MSSGAVSLDSREHSGQLLADLLTSQGWDFRRPPHGNIHFLNEYRDGRRLVGELSAIDGEDILRDPTGILIVDPGDKTPLAVIEAESSKQAIGRALFKAREYAATLHGKGFRPLAVGLAGTKSDEFELRVSKWHDDAADWMDVTYGGIPIGWIPNEKDIRMVSAMGGPVEIKPTTPPAEAMAGKADEINRLLREAGVKDRDRPPHAAAFMVALWHSRGDLRRSQNHVLREVNKSCAAAFTKFGRLDLSDRIFVDEGNIELREAAPRVLTISERLNIAVLTREHDYLGELFETFIRHIGGGTIGRHFTPRHIARFMVDACRAGWEDTVADFTCGTGGFFVSYKDSLSESKNMDRGEIANIMQNNILGFEVDPITSALCVTNMILRGVGSLNIKHADSLAPSPDFPRSQVDVVLMNPPLTPKKKDPQIQEYLERGLQSLRRGGQAAMIVPTNFLSKGGDASKWRKRMLNEYSLAAVCQLPDEIFQPFASTSASAIILENRSHDAKRITVFVRLRDDGFIMRNGIRTAHPSAPNRIPDAIAAMRAKSNFPGFSVAAGVTNRDDWSAGAHIPPVIADENELKAEVDVILRKMTLINTRYSVEVLRQRNAIENGELKVGECRDLLSPINSQKVEKAPGSAATIGDMFDIHYGTRVRGSTEAVGPGKTMVVSSASCHDGTCEWLNFPEALSPEFITLSRFGAIGEAMVQIDPCVVTRDCLVLHPKDEDTSDLTTLVLAAAALHTQKWRFKCYRRPTPDRISNIPIPRSANLEKWTDDRVDIAIDAISLALRMYDENSYKNDSGLPLMMHGVDPRDALRAFMETNPEALRIEESRMHEHRSEDEIDAEMAYIERDKPGGVPLNEI